MTKNSTPDVRLLDLKRDERGWLLKVLMRHHIAEANRDFGEIYLTAARTGQVKGNHYHNETREWFCLVQGRARLVMRDLETDEITEIEMSGDAPATVEVPPRIAHAIQCVGDDLAILLAYADQPYDADNPDEVRYVLIEPTDIGPETTSMDPASAGASHSTATSDEPTL